MIKAPSVRPMGSSSGLINATFLQDVPLELSSVPQPTSHVSSCSEHASGGVHILLHVPLHAAHALRDVVLPTIAAADTFLC